MSEPTGLFGLMEAFSTTSSGGRRPPRLRVSTPASVLLCYHSGTVLRVGRGVSRGLGDLLQRADRVGGGQDIRAPDRVQHGTWGPQVDSSSVSIVL